MSSAIAIRAFFHAAICMMIVGKSFAIDAAPVHIERHQSKVSLRGEKVDSFTLSNGILTLTISCLGASITSLHAPDIHGITSDVVLGFPDHERDAQVQSSPYFSCIVGRVANRIANGTFTLDGKKYVLARNNGPNHLHGGENGFDKRVWSMSRLLPEGVQLELRSPDGDQVHTFPFSQWFVLAYVVTHAPPILIHRQQGYPGNLDVIAEYRLLNNSVELRMRARSDAPTPINLAQHSYFNLAGHAAGPSPPPTVLGHEVQISADSYTPVDADSIPSGELAPVDGTEFDLRQPAILGERVAALARRAGFAAARYDTASGTLLGADGPAPAGGGPPGFDHNFVVAGGCAAPRAAPAAAPPAGPGVVRHVATVREPASGRTLTVESDAPGVQFYTGNYLGPATPGKARSGAGYPRHAGLCLETQHFPDSAGDGPRPAAYAAGAAPTLRPGGPEYAHTVVFRFDARPGGPATAA